jgi:hypothetical protein
MRIVRSGLCGLLAHGPLSHLYYVALDHAFAQTSVSLTLNRDFISTIFWFIKKSIGNMFADSNRELVSSAGQGRG